MVEVLLSILILLMAFYVLKDRSIVCVYLVNVEGKEKEGEGKTSPSFDKPKVKAIEPNDNSWLNIKAKDKNL